MSAFIIAGCIAIGAVASMLGVSTRTLRRWDAAGSLKPAFRTAGNHRRYDRHAVLCSIQHGGGYKNRHDASEHASRAAPRAAVYSRVSSTRQSLDGELDRQQATIVAHCTTKEYRVSGTYRDVGSGLNDGRRGLVQLLKDVARGKHDIVVVSYQDRLSRFGLGVIKEFLASWGVGLEVMHPTVVNGTPHAELVTDLTAILYSFMGRLYRARRGRKEGDATPP
nr:IS607 family transposase [Candidatus Sigynarchaeum springense]